MIFAAPRPFAEALESHEARALLPTEFRHRATQLLAPEVKARAFWSAGVTNAQVLQRAHEGIDEIVKGTTDRATQRAKIKQLLAQLNYQPSEDERGTLTDLSSDARLNLILDTNTQLADGFGQKAEGNDPAILDAWPAQELFRAIAHKAERDWPGRWAQVGGKFYDGRMIALKDDEIWSELGSSENFDDALDVDYAPFAFNSGMRTRDVSRADAMEFGLIDRDTQIEPAKLDFNGGLKSATGIVDHALRGAVVESLLTNGIRAAFDGEGVLRFVGSTLAHLANASERDRHRALGRSLLRRITRRQWLALQRSRNPGPSTN